MKAFEEWWKENRFGKNHTPGPKEVWKAALESVLADINGHDYDYGYYDYSTYEVRCRIEEELER